MVAGKKFFLNLVGTVFRLVYLLPMVGAKVHESSTFSAYTVQDKTKQQSTHTIHLGLSKYSKGEYYKQ